MTGLFGPAHFEGPNGIVAGPWWLWRHQYFRGHSMDLVEATMHCSCGRSTPVRVFSEA